MSKDEDSDERLLELAQAVVGQKLAAQSEKVDLTLKVDKLLKKRLQVVYGRSLSRLFEEAMLAKLLVDGHLKGAKGPTTHAGGGAEGYFNPKPEPRKGPVASVTAKDLKPIYDAKKKTWRKRREDDDE